MNRTILIGLDGAPFSLLDPLAESGVMPFLREFLQTGSRAPLRSTPHPLTPPAWTSLMTGRSPGHHGIFDFIWAEQRESNHYFTIHNYRDIRSETIWSLVSRQQGTITTLNFPFLAPPPRVNGFVVPGFVSWKYLRRNVYPRDLYDELKTLPGFDVKELAWDFEQEKKAEQGVPEEEYERWVDFHIARERQWFAVTRRLLRQHPTDLTAILFDGLDKILHMGYRFVDPQLFPAEPSAWECRLRDRCHDYFRELDGFIEEIVELGGPEARVFIASDHGFGPTWYVFRANTWLAEQGYLVWQDLDRLDEADRRAAQKVADRHFVMLDWERTTAYARTVTSNGIFIRRQKSPGDGGVPPEEYHEFRAELIRKLKDVREPDTGRPLIVDVLLKEDVFSGPNNEQAPDLTLVMRDHGFLSIKHKEPVVLRRPVVEGTHYPDGVFAARGPGIRAGASLPTLSILDVAPALMYSLGLPIPSDFEGHLPQAAFEAEQLDRQPPQVGPPTESPDLETESVANSGLSDQEEEEEVYKRLKALGYVE